MDEREYDKIYNEGGEGYNPIRAKREQEECEAAQAKAKAYAATPQGQIAALRRRIEIECGSIAREWDSESIDALRRDLRAQIAVIEAGINADFLAEWTPEVLAARRTEWNARVKAGEFGRVGSKRIDFKAVTTREKAQGWTLDELKRAISLHK
jgi:hypothetical protein